MKHKIQFNKNTQKYICPYCKKEFCKKGINSHIWRKHTEEGKKLAPFKGKTKQAWNKGKTKETNESLKKTSMTLKKRYSNSELKIWSEGKHLSLKAKQKISQSKKRLNPFKHRFNKKQLSIHENRIINLLKQNNINGWECNYKVCYKEKPNFFRRYLYDIAFPELLIDIEIDGWEHELAHRIEIDKIRDELSKKYGWIVIRLKIKEILNLDNNTLLKKIEDIIYQAKKSINDRKILYQKNPYFEYLKIKNNHKTKEQLKIISQEKINNRIKIILNSNIDFSKWCWSKELSKLLGITQQKCIDFIRKYMPEFYKTCKHKKNKII